MEPLSDPTPPAESVRPDPTKEITFITLTLTGYYALLIAANWVENYSDWLRYLLPNSLLLLTTRFWLRRYPPNYRLATGGIRARPVGITMIATTLLLGIYLFRSLLGFGFGSDWSFVLQTIILVTVVPIVEEMFFRGVILDHLMTNLGRGGGLLLTSVLFATLHSGAGTIVSFFLLALVLGLLTIATRSVLWAIVLHCQWNAAAALPGIAPPFWRGMLILAILFGLYRACRYGIRTRMHNRA